MMARETFAAPPPGVHSYPEDQWQQQQQKNMPAAMWQQSNYHSNNPPMSAHGGGPVFYDPFAQHHQSQRANNFVMPAGSYGNPWQRSSYQFQQSYGGASLHPNAYLNSHFGHGSGSFHGNPQVRGYPQHFPASPNKQQFHQNSGPQWMAPVKNAALIGANSNTSSPLHTANGSISPMAFRNGSLTSLQRVDSAVEASTPRGPPRKARQSGFALWVGNLPFGASITELKDHFSRDAKDDIESLCLLASSSCAFVNYRSEEACIAAHQRFNGSRFGPVRLLCRVRNGKDQKESTGGLLLSRPPGLQTAQSLEHDISSDLSGLTIDEKRLDEGLVEGAKVPPEKVGDRIFVLKSLTVRDLQISLQKGLWETQEHNRSTLDRAFDGAENVYLIFSANKSGEYFGYARMGSRSFEPQPVDDQANAPETDPDYGLIITPTEATETAPPGRVVEDVVRKQIFWEISGDAQASPEVGNAGTRESSQNRCFQVEWKSVQVVPFRRTKGMRNAWNENKEVKVARDGTELEPEVGRQLLALFHGSAGGIRS